MASNQFVEGLREQIDQTGNQGLSEGLVTRKYDIERLGFNMNLANKTFLELWRELLILEPNELKDFLDAKLPAKELIEKLLGDTIVTLNKIQGKGEREDKYRE